MNSIETAERVAYEALRLAQVNEDKGAMASSAKLAAKDALECFNAGDYEGCVLRARTSLRYSVGVFHADYAAVGKSSPAWSQS